MPEEKVAFYVSHHFLSTPETTCFEGWTKGGRCREAKRKEPRSDTASKPYSLELRSRTEPQSHIGLSRRRRTLISEDVLNGSHTEAGACTPSLCFVAASLAASGAQSAAVPTASAHSATTSRRRVRRLCCDPALSPASFKCICFGLSFRSC